MPKKKQTGPLRASAPRTPVEPVGEGALMTTRIDPPHQIAAAEPARSRSPTPSPPADARTCRRQSATPRRPAAIAAGRRLCMPLAQTFEQMQSQAAQLAAQLCKQQATPRPSRSRGQRPGGGRRKPGSHGPALAGRKTRRACPAQGRIESGDPAADSPARTARAPSTASAGSGLADAGIPTGNSSGQRADSARPARCDSGNSTTGRKSSNAGARREAATEAARPRLRRQPRHDRAAGRTIGSRRRGERTQPSDCGQPSGSWPRGPPSWKPVAASWRPSAKRWTTERGSVCRRAAGRSATAWPSSGG